MTVDLPDYLMREIKLRAVQEGRKLKDVIAGLLASAMAEPRNESSKADGPSPKGLPVMKVRPIKAAASRMMNPQELSDWINDADLQLDLEKPEAAFGHQHVEHPDD